MARGGKPIQRSGTASAGGTGTAFAGDLISLDGTTWSFSILCPSTSPEGISFSFNNGQSWIDLAKGEGWDGPVRHFEVRVGSPTGAGTYKIIAVI